MRDTRSTEDEMEDDVPERRNGGDRDRRGAHAARRVPITDGGLRISKLLDALAEQRRRHVLYYLKDERHAELEAIAQQIAAWEHKTQPAELDEQTCKTMQVTLHQIQLPKLEDAGLIEYDRRNKSLRYYDLPAYIEQLLDDCATVERSDELEG